MSFAGLIIVDNMHFQYNTLLYGILILSISEILEENFVKGAIIYTILLNLKHIFIYLVFIYFNLVPRLFCVLFEILRV